MKLLKRGVIIPAVALLAISCSEEDRLGLSGGEGAIRLALSASPEVAVAAPTRNAIPQLEAPEINQFAIRLTKSDNSYSQTWNSIDEFNAETSFRTGSYNLEAYMGDVDVEGFDAPCFYGAATVSVVEAKETEASITATLANSMVSVDYTDAFKNYFKDYSARVHSAGHSYIDFAADETRPAFIAPGEVDLAVSFTNPQGQSTSVQPAGFTAKPRHHYRVHFDVTQGAGNAVLVISFDDTLVAEDVTIDLTDELFTTPAPQVKPEGFQTDVPVEVLEGNASLTPYAFTVVARGGMAEANLTVDSDYRPAFGNEINLVGASASAQQQIEASGITAVGFFRNPDRLARLDLSGFMANLPQGTHKISLVVKDKYSRVSDPVTLVVSTEPVHISASAESVIFVNNQALVNIDYNGSNAEKAFTFKALDKYGVYQDCPVVQVAAAQKLSRAFPVKGYAFSITLPDTERNQIPLQILYNGVKKAEIMLEVITPAYDVVADPFANKVVLKFVPENASDLAAIINAAKISVVSTRSTRSGSFTFTRDAKNGLITVSGFNPATSYTINTSLTADASASPATSTSITTEAAAGIPNGDFSLTQETINISGVLVGGPFTGTIWGSPQYNTHSSIVRSEPVGWASVNQKTCYEGSSNINTWFLVPSTFAENEETTVRSVAFNHAGTTPAVDKRTAKYYNNNVPSFADNQKAAGELFLGSYSFDGTEHRSEGMAFASRPASISFQYRYSPLNGEKATAEIAVVDEAGKTIASGSMLLDAASSMTEKTISLSGYPFGTKASRILVKFKSTNASVPAITVPSGDSGLAEFSGVHLSNTTKAANDYKAFASGSVLTVDNVKLNY